MDLSFDAWMEQMQAAQQKGDLDTLRDLMEHRPQLDVQQLATQSATEYQLSHCEKCEACEGRGTAWLGAPGVGDDGQQCPYCFPFRAFGYPIGQLDPQVRTLPYERETGRYWFQAVDDLTRAPTIPPDAPNTPRRLRTSGPIARPRERTAPMPSNLGGIVRHWTRHFTGPNTSWRRQKAFIEAYPALRAAQRRRDRRRQEMLQWFLKGVLMGVCVGMFILVLMGVWRFVH